MSSIFGTVCLVIRHYLVYFYLIACVACFWSLLLGAEDFNNLLVLDVQDFEQQLVGEQGK
jgi:hypothetical protein